jgi:hypothetical protein
MSGVQALTSFGVAASANAEISSGTAACTPDVKAKRFWASRYRNKGTMQQRLRFKRRLRSVHT